MSMLRGQPGEHWPLSRAFSTMGEAARQGAAPGAHWLAGFAYQGMSFGWTFGMVVAAPLWQGSPFGAGVGPRRLTDPLFVIESGGWALLFLIVPVSFRLATGLATLSSAARWNEARGRRNTPRLRHIFRAGKGMTLPALGLWLQVLAMMVGATLLFIGPTRLLVEALRFDDDNPVTVLAMGSSIALIFFYGFALSILFQLSLQSLVQNRRGVGSALLHAWRIAKNDAAGLARATAVDAFVYLTAFATLTGLAIVNHLARNQGLLALLILVAWFALDGVVGCMRCAYWSRTYAGLGGISTLPQVHADVAADDADAAGAGEKASG